MASDIASLLEHLSNDQTRSHLLAHGVVLVGHSMGAKVALGTVASLPAHLRQQLRGLVLVAPAPPGPLDLPDEMKEQQKAAYASEQSVRWTVENVLARSENLSEEDIRLVVHDSLSGNQLAKEAWPTYGMREDISGRVKEALASISHGNLRVRIIVGELDIVEPKERVDAEVRCFLEECGLQVEVNVAAGVKHLIPLECPEVVYKELSIF
ncbi:putative serine aminopeptidase, S33 [Lyophyllum shimeji]|uniref:Serine aminopeptidase, S33 n=1 Tax=Lyophyllum shimeji TaxID=47721 RepID=A0A9P3Q1P1_LYOSH|nr:putative serine aminopeptidase, S33 [Lyophyllum shimeji]